MNKLFTYTRVKMFIYILSVTDNTIFTDEGYKGYRVVRWIIHTYIYLYMVQSVSEQLD